ncbi:MAG: DMT family transporter [Roseiarcus sp.]|jgi:drug/metabolite transporter (DMT)-like permease|uniref:DMT family transporter n=1 Tax=Roseiarcus sp. TaxID=1969460 RepID=UPI003C24C6E3
MRLLAVLLMCAATVCFSGIDSSAKWLGMRLPEAEVVWARYVGAAFFSLLVVRPLSRPQVFRARRPWLQLVRSALLLGSTYFNFLALTKLQLAETSTISFLSPLFVALLAGPWLGERVGGPRMAAIAVGFLGVVIATRPGTSAFQPIVFVAIAGVVCNAFYGLTTRMLAGRDSAETTLVWTSIAGVVAATPFLPWFWVTPQGPKVWAIMALMGASGAFGHWLMILAHQRAPASAMAPFGYTQLLWMIVIGWLVFGDTPPGATLFGAGIVIGCGVFLAWRERRGGR